MLLLSKRWETNSHWLYKNVTLMVRDSCRKGLEYLIRSYFSFKYEVYSCIWRWSWLWTSVYITKKGGKERECLFTNTQTHDVLLPKSSSSSFTVSKQVFLKNYLNMYFTYFLKWQTPSPDVSFAAMRSEGGRVMVVFFAV